MVRMASMAVPSKLRRKATQGSRVFEWFERGSEFLSGVGEGCCFGGIILASRNITLKKRIWAWREGSKSNKDKERDWDRTRETWEWGEGERKKI